MGPRVRSTQKTPYNIGACVAFPEHPGLLRGMIELLGYRVTSDTIRRWRNGRRKPPQWAIDMLAEHLRNRAREYLDAADRLEKEKGPLKPAAF
jgi:hypothetical protein